jgi:hypothetical protein
MSSNIVLMLFVLSL